LGHTREQVRKACISSGKKYLTFYMQWKKVRDPTSLLYGAFTSSQLPAGDCSLDSLSLEALPSFARSYFVLIQYTPPKNAKDSERLAEAEATCTDA
jgi:hypothetical protein